MMTAADKTNLDEGVIVLELGDPFTQPLLWKLAQMYRDIKRTDYAFALENALMVADYRPPMPIPMRLPCPLCKELHIDVGLFAERPHDTHACQHCGHVWRPAVQCTVGVRFLPGFKNAEEEE